jgi:hypothetical protein
MVHGWFQEDYPESELGATKAPLNVTLSAASMLGASMLGENALAGYSCFFVYDLALFVSHTLNSATGEQRVRKLSTLRAE